MSEKMTPKKMRVFYLVALFALMNPSHSDQAAYQYNALDEIHKTLVKARADGVIHGAAFKVYNQHGEIVFPTQQGHGNVGKAYCDVREKDTELRAFDSSCRVPLASSTKWVSSSLVLSVIDDFEKKGRSNLLNLSTPIGQYLGSCFSNSERQNNKVTEMLSTVTVKHLLSFTSGLVPEHPCVGNPGNTENPLDLKSCSCMILKSSLGAKHSFPGAGKVYVYGSTHLTLAGSLLVDSLKQDQREMTIQEALKYFVTSRLGNIEWSYGNSLNPNPNLAGSIHATLDEYAEYLKVLTKGNFSQDPSENSILFSPHLALKQREDALEPITKILSSPWQPKGSVGIEHHYGLNVFRECYVNPPLPGEINFPETPNDTGKSFLKADPTCSGTFTFGHAGKFGFNPWIDSNHNYFAILALREDGDKSGGSTGGIGYKTATKQLVLNLRMHINAHLNRAPTTPSISAIPASQLIVTQKKNWSLALAVEDPDRDEIEVECLSCPTGFKALISPRVAGKKDQTLNLQWIPTSAQQSSTEIVLSLKDRSLAPKKTEFKLNLSMQKFLDKDKDNVEDHVDCAPSDPKRWQSLDYTYTDRDEDGYFVASQGKACSGKKLSSEYLAKKTLFTLIDCDDSKKYKTTRCR